MKVHVPTSWEGLTIKQFSDLHKLSTIEQETIDTMLDTVQIVCELDYATVSRFTLNDLKAIYSKLDFLSEMPKGDKLGDYDLDGVFYKACTDISKISAGQYIDLKTFVQDGALNNIHNIMSVLYVPYKKKYNEVPISDIADKFYNKMPISVAYPFAVFFCNLLDSSMPDINLCLEKQAIQMTRKAIQEVQALAK